MNYRDKVIKGLECCEGYGCAGEECPYWETNCNALRHDALELLKEQENNLLIQYEEGFHDGYKQAMREIPEIIRCKDCKHSGMINRDRLWCPARCEIVKDYWFCADGERQEGR